MRLWGGEGSDAKTDALKSSRRPSPCCCVDYSRYWTVSLLKGTERSGYVSFGQDMGSRTGLVEVGVGQRVW